VGWKITPAAIACPGCGGELIFRRIDDPHIVEYRARCRICDWKGPLRELRCGVCHRDWLFTWTGDAWRCTRCGHVRGPNSATR